MHGFEREGIRITEDGSLSRRPHPAEFGSSLTHAFITTDFCEPQLELITPPDDDLAVALRWLEQVQRHVNSSLDDELIWPFSMPPRLPDRDDEIELAEYGTSAAGREKTVYRSGIGLRYGRRRLTISGTHYSFSFGDSPLTHELLEARPGGNDAADSDPWLHIVRNLYRRLPYLVYLFGASPAYDESFEPENVAGIELHGERTRYARFATSLRMSDVGYTSRVQDALSFRYDSIEQHASDLAYATSTCNPDYVPLSEQQLGQLSPNYLQRENELYRPFRLQQNTHPGETLVDALRRCGVGRIESRLLDIDPNQPGGVDSHAVCFLHLAILDCLTHSSPRLGADEWRELNEINRIVAWRGREPNLRIATDGASDFFRERGAAYCDGLAPLAERMDAEAGLNAYRSALKDQIAKWNQPEYTPSGKQIASLLDGDKEFLELGLQVAAEHREVLRSGPNDVDMQRAIGEESERSVAAYGRLDSDGGSVG